MQDALVDTLIPAGSPNRRLAVVIRGCVHENRYGFLLMPTWVRMSHVRRPDVSPAESHYGHQTFTPCVPLQNFQSTFLAYSITKPTVGLSAPFRLCQTVAPIWS